MVFETKIRKIGTDNRFLVLYGLDMDKSSNIRTVRTIYIRTSAKLGPDYEMCATMEITIHSSTLLQKLFQIIGFT
jgi:hypothetical protein